MTQVSTSHLADHHSNTQGTKCLLIMSSSQHVHGCPVDGTCFVLVRKLFCITLLVSLSEPAIQPEVQMP